jgi:CBS domain containing-hemolysin-like protein
MAQLAIIVLLVLFGSAICSGTEAALFSIPPLRIRQLAQTRKPAAVALLEIRGKINRPVAAIVILNNIFNIIGSIIRVHPTFVSLTLNPSPISIH